MIIKINTRRATNFIRRHKEAVIVGVIAIVVIHRQANSITSMLNFMDDKGVADEYCEFNIK